MIRPVAGGLAFEAEEKEKTSSPGQHRAVSGGWLERWLQLPSQGGRPDFLLRKGSHRMARPRVCFRVFSEDVISKLWRLRDGRKSQSSGPHRAKGSSRLRVY